MQGRKRVGHVTFYLILFVEVEICAARRFSRSVSPKIFASSARWRFRALLYCLPSIWSPAGECDRTTLAALARLRTSRRVDSGGQIAWIVTDFEPPWSLPEKSSPYLSHHATQRQNACATEKHQSQIVFSISTGRERDERAAGARRNRQGENHLSPRLASVRRTKLKAPNLPGREDGHNPTFKTGPEFL